MILPYVLDRLSRDLRLGAFLQGLTWLHPSSVAAVGPEQPVMSLTFVRATVVFIVKARSLYFAAMGMFLSLLGGRDI